MLSNTTIFLLLFTESIAAQQNATSHNVSPQDAAKCVCAGIPTEFHAYDGLPHGFGPGTGTAAEGWLMDAVRFGDTQIR